MQRCPKCGSHETDVNLSYMVIYCKSCNRNSSLLDVKHDKTNIFIKLLEDIKKNTTPESKIINWIATVGATIVGSIILAIILPLFSRQASEPPSYLTISPYIIMGIQQGTMIEGTYGTVYFQLWSRGLKDGHYRMILQGSPQGILIEPNEFININNNTGVVQFTSDSTAEAGIWDIELRVIIGLDELGNDIYILSNFNLNIIISSGFGWSKVIID